ncbi:MAG: hypothetical protein ACO3MW_14815 [Rhodospirillales bacterium]
MINHLRKMPFSITLAGIIAGLLLSACTKSADLNSSVPAARTEPGKIAEPSFAQFPDIPIPSEAEMDVDKTLILGGGEHWLGRLVLNTSTNANSMFSFYKRKMSEHGWQEITSVRSSISVLTFSRGERVATIQIQGRTLRGAETRITMSPRDRSPQPVNTPLNQTTTGGKDIIPPAVQQQQIR